MVAIPFEVLLKLKPLPTPNSAKTRLNVPIGMCQRRTRISAIPGQKKKAYALEKIVSLCACNSERDLHD